MSNVIGWVFLGIGISFNFLGTLGLVRMPDLYCRLQVSTKCVTLGTASILFGAFLITGFSSIGMKSLICLVFLFFNAPTSSHALSRAYYIRGIKVENIICDALKEDSKNKK